jgi:AcrR family transcriptional regulator
MPSPTAQPASFAAPRRRRSGYHSPLRQRQAAETRQSVLRAGIRLFGERGWTGTTLAAVAKEAGTAVETIYSTFGSKAGLLMAAMDVAIVGDDEEAPMIERDTFAALGSGPRRDRLRRATRLAQESYVRTLPVLGALEEAAASDETARARLVRYEEDRRSVIEAGLELIVGGPVPVAVVDAVWVLASPETLRMLTEERGWSTDEYEEWLAQMVDAALRRGGATVGAGGGRG